MSPAGVAWFAALNRHIAAARKRLPLPEKRVLSAAHAARCELQGATLLGSLEHFAPQLIQQRGLFSHLDQSERKPFIILLSDLTGLVAAREIVGESDRIAYLTAAEFDTFNAKHPDNDYRWHVRFVDEISPASGKDAVRAAKEYPLKRGEEHWLHHAAAIMGPLFGRGARHLLRWNGRNVAVLEQCFDRWIS